MGAAVDPAGIVPATEAEAFEVWKENKDALEAFLAVETQWRVAATMAGLIWLGLDYSAVDVVLRRLDLPGSVFGQLQMMEAAALAAFNEAQA